MPAALLACIVCLVSVSALGETSAGRAREPASCGPRDGLHFVCGPVASEDLALIPGTRWLVTSGLNAGSPAHLYLVNVDTKAVATLFPRAGAVMRVDPTLRTGCAGAPDLALLSTDGLNIRAGVHGQHLLYVANHGGRNSIELFRIDAQQSIPAAAWVGCVVLPAGTLANAVVPLSDGGMLVSSFYDPRDPGAWERMDRGENTGSLWEWHADQGFRRLQSGNLSGANGLETSADERFIYVSAWSGRELLILDRQTGARRAIALGFLPDNIKRAADGTLLVGGQRSTVASIAACHTAACPQAWIIARVDPIRGSMTPLITRAGNPVVSYACGAVQAGDSLFITARSDRRLLYVPLDSLPSLQ